MLVFCNKARGNVIRLLSRALLHYHIIIYLHHCLLYTVNDSLTKINIYLRSKPLLTKLIIYVSRDVYFIYNQGKTWHRFSYSNRHSIIVKIDDWAANIITQLYGVLSKCQVSKLIKFSFHSFQNILVNILYFEPHNVRTLI